MKTNGSFVLQSYDSNIFLFPRSSVFLVFAIFNSVPGSSFQKIRLDAIATAVIFLFLFAVAVDTIEKQSNY